MKRLALFLLASAGWLATVASAAPLSPAEVTKLCTQAEGLAHCGRLVEAVQLKRLGGLATRDGDTLRVSLFPAGSVTFTDVDKRSGGDSYALWDHLSGIDATVLYITKDDSAGFLLLQRRTGKQTPLPGEPVLSPDRQRFATADFCDTRCENRLAVWRVTREGVRREAEWTPPVAWADAAVRWKDADTLVIEYTPAGTSEAQMLERKLADAGWMRR